MYWLPIALIAPIVWAIVNHIDKYLLERYFQSKNVGSLFIYSSLTGILLAGVALFFEPAVFVVSFGNIVVLLSIGILIGAAILAYLCALAKEEATLVAPIFQLIPFFGYVLAFFILGESLAMVQIFAGLLIIGGSMILSLEIEEDQRLRPKWNLMGIMLISAILHAVHEVVFKLVAQAASFWPSIFWSSMGLFLTGVAALILMPAYRDVFLSSLRKNGAKIIAINLFSETLNLGGGLAILYAIMLAPVAIVQTTTAYQPLIVFIIGIALTVFFPKIAKERISTKHLVHKSLAIGVILIGSVLLYK